MIEFKNAMQCIFSARALNPLALVMGEYASFSALHCFNLILGHCIFLAFYLPQQPLSTAELKFILIPCFFLPLSLISFYVYSCLSFLL
ncbi:hypothetical protein HHE06_03480 [Helicobacter heilmannii]|nr:hypothetical protein HHE06_03480 [Helicobacter heilmannii]